MSTDNQVAVKCRECGEIAIFNVDDWKQLKKDGVVEASRGRYDYWTCGKHKSQSRGKAKAKPEVKPATKPKKPTSTPTIGATKKSEKKAPVSKVDKTSGAELTSSGNYFVESDKFPPTITVHDGREFVCVMPYTDRITKSLSEKIKAMKVDTVVVSNGASTSVYADAKTFKYVHFRMPRTGNVIVYKDKSVTPPKKMQLPSGKGKTVAVKYLFRKRGTVDEIFDEIFKRKIEASGIYKFKVFGLGGRYLVKTFDIFTDVVQPKPKPRVPKLSADYKKWCELHKDELISDPHCGDCQNKSCPDSAASGGICGDDACPTRFRM